MKRYLLTFIPFLLMGFGVYDLIGGFNEGTIRNLFSHSNTSSPSSYSVNEHPSTFWFMMAITAFYVCICPYASYIMWTKDKE